MPGTLTFHTLKEAVARGEIDTVLVASVDMQGRLMGKRFHAAFFVESGYKETHCCNYLLAVDMEMNTVPGYKSAGWEQGYGDYVMKPDLATLRALPWLPGTALCLADLLDHHTQEEISRLPPRHPEETGRPRPRLGVRTHDGHRTGILHLRKRLRKPARPRLHQPQADQRL